MTTYTRVIDELRQAYDRKADERDGQEPSGWKTAECETFLSLLLKENKHRLLEIGAGPGWASRRFSELGLDVVATDLSLEMVRLCQAKGLTAFAMDFLHLDFPPGSFDAVFAMNCLLHVPEQDLRGVLEAIRKLLVPGGLFYFGTYGGIESEGPYPEDTYEPKRFFSFHTDKRLFELTREHFDLISFKRIDLEGEERIHFQALILQPLDMFSEEY